MVLLYHYRAAILFLLLPFKIFGFFLSCLVIEQIIASPINVGGGHVNCSHGILPVPAPATASILKGIPIYNGDIKEELCTPTGAALLKYFVTDFADMPVMKVEKILFIIKYLEV